MKCKKCQKTIPRGSKFCNHCGTNQEQSCFYQRPDGLFEKKLNINGKRVVFRAKTEEEIFLKISNYHEKEERGITFWEAADLWHTEHWYTLSPTTQKGYKCAYDEVRKYFKNNYIKRITHRDINKYIKQLPSSYARKTCVTRLQILNMVFKYAITEDLCEVNPCEYITIPKGHSSKKRRAPTSKEIECIKANVDIKYKGFPIGKLAAFLLCTGCRKGEALALTFKDIDRKNKRITVNKSIYWEHNEGQVKLPKTEAGIREIIIPDYLLPLIPNGKGNKYVFSPTSDKPMRDHFFRSAWETWTKQSGLNLTAHQLRHGYATLLHEADVDVKDAQDQLGHADASTTQNIYTEVSAKRKIEIARKINNIIQ